MPDRSSWSLLWRGLIALLCALAIALALGAVWLAVALRLGNASDWLALPVGLAIGYAIRAWATRSRGYAMLLSAAGTWLAAIYMMCLSVALHLAAIMGLSFGTTLHKAGIGMLLALARTAWSMSLTWACVVGMLLALAVAGMRSRHAQLRHHPAP